MKRSPSCRLSRAKCHTSIRRTSPIRIEAAILAAIEPLLGAFVAQHDGPFSKAVELGLKTLDENMANVSAFTPELRQRVMARLREKVGGPAEAKGLNREIFARMKQWITILLALAVAPVISSADQGGGSVVPSRKNECHQKDEGYVVVDANGQSLAYVYARGNESDASIASLP